MGVETCRRHPRANYNKRSYHYWRCYWKRYFAATLRIVAMIKLNSIKQFWTLQRRAFTVKGNALMVCLLTRATRKARRQKRRWEDEFSKRMLVQRACLAASLENNDDSRKIKTLGIYWSNQYDPKAGKFGDPWLRQYEGMFDKKFPLFRRV